jgi:hypothetical protein
MKKTKHPMQPVELVDGIARFKPNAIVKLLLKESFDLDIDTINTMVQHGKLTKEDEIQLMQLLGYSVDGFADLSKKAVKKARRRASKLVTPSACDNCKCHLGKRRFGVYSFNGNRYHICERCIELAGLPT